MRVPYGWLHELAPAPWQAKELGDRLTMAGFELEELLEVDGEPVLDIKVTSNRGDALSLLGLAREVAALNRSRVMPPPVCVTESGPDVHTLAKVIVEAPDLCPRYAARVIRGVTIGPLARMGAGAPVPRRHPPHQQRGGRHQLRDAGAGPTTARL